MTTSAFLGVLHEVGPKTVLSWRDDEKPNRVVALTTFLRDRDIETESMLSAWLEKRPIAPTVASVRGVGPKTVDYLKILVGGQTAAVDRYGYAVLEEAGVPVSGYDEAREILNETADDAGIPRATFDHSVWRFMSTRKKTVRARGACTQLSDENTVRPSRRPQ